MKRHIILILCAIFIFIAGLYFGNIWHLYDQNAHIERCEQERVNCENKLLMKHMGIIAGMEDTGKRQVLEGK